MNWREKSLQHQRLLGWGEPPLWLIDEIEAENAEPEQPRPRNTVQSDLAAHRRARVSELRAQGLTVEEIRAELAATGCLNPYTSRSWSHGAVAGDLAVLREKWRDTYRRTMADVAGQMLADLEISEAVAWSNQDFSRILQIIDRKRRLLGLDGNVIELDRDAFIVAARQHGRRFGIPVEKLLERAEKILGSDGPHRWLVEEEA